MQHWKIALVAAALVTGLSGCAVSGNALQSLPAEDTLRTAVFVSSTGEAITAAYRRDDRVTLTFADGQRETLERAVSASGIRYLRRDREWWEHQARATYRVGGELVFSGILKDKP